MQLLSVSSVVFRCGLLILYSDCSLAQQFSVIRHNAINGPDSVNESVLESANNKVPGDSSENTAATVSPSVSVPLSPPVSPPVSLNVRDNFASEMIQRMSKNVSVQTSNLDMFVGEVKVFGNISVTRVAVGNGSIIKAEVINTRELVIIAESPGSSSLRLWHSDGSQSDFNIRVTENDPETRFPVEAMISLRVKMVEFRRNALTRLGIDWGNSVAGPTFATAGDLLTNGLYRPSAELAGATLPNAVEPFSSYFGIASSISSRINFLSATGDAVLLAEPTLSCVNGGTASFLAGGEVPYPIAGANGQSTVEFKDYGIKLDVSPRIDTSGNVQTSVTTEISSIDPAVSVDGAPGLLTRRAQTQLSVRSGQTIVIAGLLKTENSVDADRIPGLANVPVLGRLFKSENVRSDTSELVIFITPEAIDPDAPELPGHHARIDALSQRKLQHSTANLGRLLRLAD